jgi:hypothetical protein
VLCLLLKSEHSSSVPLMIHQILQFWENKGESNFRKMGYMCYISFAVCVIHYQIFTCLYKLYHISPEVYKIP